MEIEAIAGNIIEVKAGAILIGLFEDTEHLEGDIAAVDQALGGAISEMLKQREIKGKFKELSLVHSLGKLPSTRVAIVGLGKRQELSPDRMRQAIAEACRLLRLKGTDNIATTIFRLGDTNPEDTVQAVVEGVLLGLYSFRRHMTTPAEYGEISRFLIVGGESELATMEQSIWKGKVIAEATNRGRDMVNEPANIMTPTRVAQESAELAKTYRLELEVLEEKEMQELGMGALLGVNQGSHQPPRFIVLKYQGLNTDEVDLALVGKGVTFDSGGISLKPQEKMEEMKGDMSGAAAVIAAMSALAQLKPKLNIIALAPCTENLPGGGAVKPGDVLKAMNGKTIEIINTDAEGRLILADALSYAIKLGAKKIVDVATLTGACHIALGDGCSGAFTNNQELLNKVISAGKEAGEFIWQLPLYEEIKEQLKSDIADMKNVGSRYGGAISAAQFLAEYVDDIPWVHLDIAGTFVSEKDRGYLVKGATGVMVRTLVNLTLSLTKN